MIDVRPAWKANQPGPEFPNLFKDITPDCTMTFIPRGLGTSFRIFRSCVLAKLTEQQGRDIVQRFIEDGDFHIPSMPNHKGFNFVV